jgi:hypothetical protein
MPLRIFDIQRRTTMRKIRITLAVTILALAAVSVANSASAHCGCREAEKILKDTPGDNVDVYAFTGP